MNELFLLLHALSAKLDGKTYIIMYWIWIYFTWPLRKQAACKQATRGPTALRIKDKVSCPRAQLPGWDSNWGPLVWKSMFLSTQPQQLLAVGDGDDDGDGQ